MIPAWVKQASEFFRTCREEGGEPPILPFALNDPAWQVFHPEETRVIVERLCVSDETISHFEELLRFLVLDYTLDDLILPGYYYNLRAPRNAHPIIQQCFLEADVAGSPRSSAGSENSCYQDEADEHCIRLDHSAAAKPIRSIHATEWFMWIRGWGCAGKEFIHLCTKAGNTAYLQWVVSYGYCLTTHLLSDALRGGHMETITWLYEHLRLRYSERKIGALCDIYLEAAAASGKEDVLTWYFAHFPVTQRKRKAGQDEYRNYGAFDAALNCPDESQCLRFFDVLVCHGIYPPTEYRYTSSQAFEIARQGKLRCLQWFMSQGITYDLPSLFSEAYHRDQVIFCTYLIQELGFLPDKRTLTLRSRGSQGRESATNETYKAMSEVIRLAKH